MLLATMIDPKQLAKSSPERIHELEALMGQELIKHHTGKSIAEVVNDVLSNQKLFEAVQKALPRP